MEDQDFTTFDLPKKRAKKRWRYLLYIGVIFAIFLAAFSLTTVNSNDSVWSNIADATQKILRPSLSQINPLMASADEPLKGEENDRINILLMGIGGRGHDGALLTDTIIFTSYKPSTKQVSMVSIPRDMIVPLPGYGWRKSNTVYALNEYEEEGSGGKAATSLFSKVLGEEISYYIVVDFKGFTDLIDLLGGIEVEVPRTLSDYQYPIPGREDAAEGSRYEHLYIEEGLQQFDGETALKYARSRHGTGGEGSDFARAARQQLVIESLRDKVLSFSTLTSPTKIKKIINNVDSNIDTNLKLGEMVTLARLARDARDIEQPIINVVLDNSIDGPLQANNYNGAFVLEPKVSGYKEIQFITQNVFNPEAVYTRPVTNSVTKAPEVIIEDSSKTEETATIEIQNGTYVQGLAGAHKQSLIDLGYDVISVGNAAVQDYNQTVVYKLTDKALPETVQFLSSNYEEPTNQIPLSVNSKADFVIVLGLDKGL